MKNTKLFIAALMCQTLLVYADNARAEPLAIVVKKTSAVTDLSSAELLKIFKGEEKQSSSGGSFVLTMQATGSPERAAFLDQVLHMSESEYQKYFLQAVFTGLMKGAPKVVNGADALKAFVSNKDGAIGYVKLSDVDDTFTVVKIDGKKPGDAGYPLNTR